MSLYIQCTTCFLKTKYMTHSSSSKRKQRRPFQHFPSCWTTPLHSITIIRTSISHLSCTVITSFSLLFAFYCRFLVVAYFPFLIYLPTTFSTPPSLPAHPILSVLFKVGLWVSASVCRWWISDSASVVSDEHTSWLVHLCGENHQHIMQYWFALTSQQVNMMGGGLSFVL